MNIAIDKEQIDQMLADIKKAAENNAAIDSIIRAMFGAFGDNCPIQTFVRKEITATGITLHPSSYLIDIHIAVINRQTLELPIIATRIINDFSVVIKQRNDRRRRMH